jgi:hypothetical protein
MHLVNIFTRKLPESGASGPPAAQAALARPLVLGCFSVFLLLSGCGGTEPDCDSLDTRNSPTALLHCLQKNFHPGLNNAGARKHANELHALVLLRYRRKRPRRGSADDNSDELARRCMSEPMLRRRHLSGSIEQIDRG